MLLFPGPPDAPKGARPPAGASEKASYVKVEPQAATVEARAAPRRLGHPVSDACAPFSSRAPPGPGITIAACPRSVGCRRTSPDIDHGRLFDELDWIESTEEFAAAIEHWLEQTVDH